MTRRFASVSQMPTGARFARFRKRSSFSQLPLDAAALLEFLAEPLVSETQLRSPFRNLPFQVCTEAAEFHMDVDAGQQLRRLKRLGDEIGRSQT